MEEMGMTDKQFNGFLRMLVRNLEDAKNEAKEGKTEKLEQVIKELYKTLEQ